MSDWTRLESCSLSNEYRYAPLTDSLPSCFGQEKKTLRNGHFRRGTINPLPCSKCLLAERERTDTGHVSQPVAQEKMQNLGRAKLTSGLKSNEVRTPTAHACTGSHGLCLMLSVLSNLWSPTQRLDEPGKKNLRTEQTSSEQSLPSMPKTQMHLVREGGLGMAWASPGKGQVGSVSGASSSPLP